MKISDFNITGQPIPESVADKILEYHLKPLECVNIANTKLNARVSVKSSYRSRAYELKRGRSGTSQHCFFGKGATDITCDDFKNQKDDLLEELIQNTTYTRLAIYKSFIHADYAIQDERWLFNSKWQRVRQIS